ncbi:hypothetical protein [Streptomyces caniscabiei]|uniref:hypothetical protein n=1 Tax=Streptomyces caniscabiei TaxID=2746961 RepID=UPI00131E9714|nr:hypothetical protein [Streptomyces caniscabiei]
MFLLRDGRVGGAVVGARSGAPFPSPSFPPAARSPPSTPSPSSCFGVPSGVLLPSMRTGWRWPPCTSIPWAVQAPAMASAAIAATDLRMSLIRIGVPVVS